MNALTILKSAKEQSSALGIMALFSLLPVFIPSIALGAELQTQGNQSQIFEINSTDSSILNTNNNQNSLQNSINIDQVQQTDPLNVGLQNWLQDNNSPLQGYTSQLLNKDNWKKVIAISFVESNLCVHNLNYNCSGIGGPGHFYKFKDFGGWIDCMSTLLDTHYNGWSLDKMNGVYVQPKSANWGYGSAKIYAQLTDLENTANQQRAEIAQASVSTTNNNLQLATIAQ